MEAVRAAATMVLGIALPFAVQRWDRGRLPPAVARRAWGYATWGGALYAFGPLSMLGWIFVTRRPWWRCLVAVPFTMAPVVALVAFDLGLSLALGEPLDVAIDELVSSVIVAPVLVAAVMLAIELITRAWRRLTGRPSPDHDWRALVGEETA